MSSATPVPVNPRPPIFDRPALLELLGAFALMTTVFGILTTRIVDLPDSRGYTAHALVIGFAIAAGVALVLAGGIVWGWRRSGGRPAQRQAMQIWRSGALPDPLPTRDLLLRNLKRQRKTLTRRRLPPIVQAVIWVLIAVLQIAAVRDLLASLSWALIAGVFILEAIVIRRRQRRLPELDALITQLQSAAP